VTRFWKRELVAPVVLAGLAGAGLYELAVALKWISLGSLPGEGPSGQPVAGIVAFLALVIGVVYYAGANLSGRPLWLEPLIPLAAVGLVTAEFYSFDPYFLPDLQRYAENEFIPAGWIYALAASALAIAVVVWIQPRVGLRLTAIFLLVCAGTSMLVPGGH
jgi:hypothetical protein